MKKIQFATIILILAIASLQAQQSSKIKIAVVKYNGGGDWYSDPTALTNLIAFANKNLKTNIAREYETVETGSAEIFNYPYVHLTGHGNIVFTASEADNLRKYLLAGGFLHIDDNYGLDEYIRPEMKKVFPELDFVELPPDHPIYHQKYDFEKGLPKIHEHDGKPAQGFGLIYQGRLVCFYTYESDLGDGWEDPEVHNDSKATRLKALKMGANILQFVFNMN
ncbi:MAG: DUF4159 domain-containing protein [Bacteroidales bacterium]|nr:DUF4159 domain-containing protein [Bacteroidales bacterium]